MRQEFVSGLSVLSRGNLHEKLLWTFSLYDTNGDGIVTKDEMLDIVSAIYDLMGKYAEPSIDEHTARDHVERVFQVVTSPSLHVAFSILLLSRVREYFHRCQRTRRTWQRTIELNLLPLNIGLFSAWR